YQLWWPLSDFLHWKAMDLYPRCWEYVMQYHHPRIPMRARSQSKVKEKRITGGIDDGTLVLAVSVIAIETGIADELSVESLKNF
uniref:Uncharacterized protein n=1 Tax=Parascaris univalens TaxID=6257 RepID=A0A914ZNE2_PARUN